VEVRPLNGTHERDGETDFLKQLPDGAAARTRRIRVAAVLQRIGISLLSAAAPAAIERHIGALARRPRMFAPPPGLTHRALKRVRVHPPIITPPEAQGDKIFCKVECVPEIGHCRSRAYANNCRRPLSPRVGRGKGEGPS
jgi:hypothetical protein